MRFAINNVIKALTMELLEFNCFWYCWMHNMLMLCRSFIWGVIGGSCWGYDIWSSLYVFLNDWRGVLWWYFNLYLLKLHDMASLFLKYYLISCQLTFLWNQRLQQHHSLIITCPRVHLSVAVASFFCEFVPWLWLWEQFRNGSLRKTQDIFGEQPLTDIVNWKKFADASWNVQCVEILIGVFIHVVAKHLLETRFHWITFGYQWITQASKHCTGR